MRAIQIEIAEISKFRMKEAELFHKVNEHSRMRLVGAVNQDASENIMQTCMRQEYIHVTASDGKNSLTLFIGCVYHVEIEHKGAEDILNLELVSGTINLDMTEKIRTFQNGSTPITDIMSFVNQNTNAKMQTSLSAGNIGDVIAQYKETDWEFVKRLASMMQSGLFPDVTGDGIGYRVGLPDNGVKQRIEIMEYAVQNDLAELRAKNSHGLGLSETDTCLYKIKSRDIMYLGDKTEINGQSVYVYEINASLIGGELVFTYMCRHKNNFKLPYTPNVKMIGASLEGSVQKVEGTTLEIALDVDKDNPLCGNKKFAYATVYSSDDGTGWYCMPEIGDKVRLYFPNEREKNAYVISSVHLEVNNSGDTSSYAANNPALSQMPAPRSDPSYKSIKNKQNKEIIFSSQSIVITNNADMTLILDDTKGIVIDSAAPVYIHSEESLNLSSSDSVLISASNAIRIEHGAQGEHCIQMEEGIITMEGKEFRLQEK